MRAPVRCRSLGPGPPPLPHPAPTSGNGASESLDLPASVPYDPGGPATPPCGPAHLAAVRPVSIPGFRLRSVADRAPPGALPWPAIRLRADAAAGTVAGAVRSIGATDPP